MRVVHNFFRINELQIGAVRIGKQWRIPVGDLPGRDASFDQPPGQERAANA